MKLFAMDQYGTFYNNLRHPRKDLCAYLGKSHVEKMYRDTKDGAKHVGYVIGGLWLEVFKFEDWHTKGAFE